MASRSRADRGVGGGSAKDGFPEATSLSFSYRTPCKIDYLTPFEALTKPAGQQHHHGDQELAHLTNLRVDRLQQSAKIEGLETLTKLKDLSLYNNQIAPEGMDASAARSSLSPWGTTPSRGWTR